MKRHLFRIFVGLFMVGSMTSCLKDDISSTIIYSSQAIPDINTYMPPRLIHLMGNDSLNVIHYGDEPPRFSGLYHIDNIYSYRYKMSDSIPPGNYGHIMNNHNIVGNYDFTFYDQVKGILMNKYQTFNPIINPVDSTVMASYETKSSIETAYNYLKDNLTPIESCPDFPTYFAREDFDPELLSHAYIIGSQNKFTIFYYDIPIYEYDEAWIAHMAEWGLTINNNLIVMANIISGTLTEITPSVNDSTMSAAQTKQYRIDNFYWGVEAIGAIREPEIMTAAPGDAQLRYNHNQPIYPTVE